MLIAFPWELPEGGDTDLAAVETWDHGDLKRSSG